MLRSSFGFLEKFIVGLCIIIFSFATCSSCASVLQQKAAAPQVQETKKYYSSVALLETKPFVDKKGIVRSGSATGFAVTKNLIMTAGHFCDTSDKEMMTPVKDFDIFTAYGTLESGKSYKIGQTEIIAYENKDLDLCILRLNSHGLKPMTLHPTSKILSTEELVTTIGAPQGHFPIRREGRVSAVVDEDYKGRDLILIAINVQGGSSGSPVIYQGSVVGIIVMTSLIVRDLGFAVPSQSIIKYLNDNVEAWRLD